MNLFVFFSNFARAFLEFFAPVLLYKLGFSVQDILLYFVVYNFAGIFYVNWFSRLGNKFGYKRILLAVPFLFGLTFAVMQFMPHDIGSIIILGIIYGAYFRMYWVARHYFVINESRKSEAANRSKWFTILETVGGLIATYAGALIIDRFGIWIGITSATTVFILACIPIWLSRERPARYKNDGLRGVWRHIPKRSMLVLTLAQCNSIAGSLFPLFIFINVQSSLEFIGGFQALVGLAAVVAVYVYGHIMNKRHSDLLLFAAIGLAIAYTFKLNISIPVLFMAVALFEGLFERFYRTSIMRDLYSLGEGFNAGEYTRLYLTLGAVFEVVLMLSALLLGFDLEFIIYICIAGVVISGFLRFKDVRNSH